MLTSIEERQEIVQGRLAKLKKGDLFDVGSFTHYLFVGHTNVIGICWVIKLDEFNRRSIVNGVPVSRERVERVDLKQAVCLNVYS